MLMENLTSIRKIIVCLVVLITSNSVQAQNPWKNVADSPLGMHVGYVSKQWATDFGDYKFKENLFSEEDKRLHGLQIGFTYQPYTRYGIGLYTGFDLDMYFASGKSMGYDNFSEVSGHVPFHALLRIPIARQTDLRIHGGLGLDYVFHGEFYDSDYHNGWYSDDYVTDRAVVHYNRDGWPARFNASAEIALGLRVKSFNLNVMYSAGLTDHKFYTEHLRNETKQNKFTVSVGWLFAND